MSYKLRHSFQAHTGEVRAITTLDNCIISGSRGDDDVCKMWSLYGDTYEHLISLIGPNNCVSTVAILPPSDTYPQGLIVTGSHDNSIMGYPPYDNNSKIEIHGHKGPVTYVSAACRPDRFLSASWDHTAKLWDASTCKIVTTFTKHTSPVWAAIEMPEGFFVTAGGDRSIIVYMEDGSVFRTLLGHDDVVRSLVSMGDFRIMSCANDGTIRTWHIPTSQCTNVIRAHNHFIYQLIVDRQRNQMAICGENGFLSVMPTNSNGSDNQVIRHPATSVWAVAFLPNSDIVTGSSDGIIRIFTRDPSRYAPETELREFNKQVALFSAKTSGENLPGREAIRRPGGQDGETRIIKENNKNYCYVWNALLNTWELIGEEEAKQKPKHNGIEYDYVFEVDIEDGRPPRKLPFNRGDDPVAQAQRFIIEEGINPEFLDKIVSFLMDNTDLGSSNGTPSTSSAVEGPTYVPPKTYYPPKDYVFFYNHDREVIFKKLSEFMGLINMSQVAIDAAICILQSLLDGQSIEKGMELLVDYMMTWPLDLCFPLLDITRLAIRHYEVQDFLFCEEKASIFFAILERLSAPVALKKCHLVVYRVMANIFAHSPGQRLIDIYMKKIIPKLLELAQSTQTGSFQVSKQIAVATCAINFSLFSLRKVDAEAMELTFEFIKALIPLCDNEEATFRLMVALGTVGIYEGAKILTDDIRARLYTVAKWPKNADDRKKASQCALSILQDLDKDLGLMLEN